MTATNDNLCFECRKNLIAGPETHAKCDENGIGSKSGMSTGERTMNEWANLWVNHDPSRCPNCSIHLKLNHIHSMFSNITYVLYFKKN